MKVYCFERSGILYYCLIEKDGFISYFTNRTTSNLGHIYKGRVVEKSKSLNGVFIEFGKEKGFLKTEKLYKDNVYSTTLRNTGDVLEVGDNVMVKVIRESTAEKGALLSSNIEIVGDNIIYTPLKQGISFADKLSDNEKSIAYDLVKRSLKGTLFVKIKKSVLGVIEKDIIEEYDLLKNKWKSVLQLYGSTLTGNVILTNDNIIPSNVEIICENQYGFTLAKQNYSNNVITVGGYNYDYLYSIISSRKIIIPDCGEIVIDKTEALTVIDVNSKNDRAFQTEEEKAFYVNAKAVDTVIEVIRIRNITGIILIDFINMNKGNEVALEALFYDKADKRVKVLGWTKAGLLEILRSNY